MSPSDDFEVKFRGRMNRNLGAGLLLMSLGMCLLLFPLVTSLQGTYYQQKLDREFIDGESNNIKLSAYEKDVAHLESSSSKFPTTRIVIPQIGLDAVVVEGFGNESLRRGPGHLPSSAPPGKAGNCCIAAHLNLYGSWFRKLNQLSRGDAIILRTSDSEYTYRVFDSFTVRPDDVSVLDQTQEPTLTLLTCVHAGKSMNRLVVVAAFSARR